MNITHWIGIGVSIAISVLLVAVAHWALSRHLAKVWSLAIPLVQRCRYSAYAAAVVIGINLALPARSDMEDTSLYGPIQHGMEIAMIGALTWLALTAAYSVTDTVLSRLSYHNGDADRKARRLQTQVRLLRRIVATVIGFLAVTAVLFTFEGVQALGAGLLASAGLISVVVGIAAQPTLGNLFSGLQLAFNDTLRINDVIVFEGEWARVEQLTLTTVTLRIWDERRLVVPVSDFTTKPFENWTKEGTAITGTVMLRVDWKTPIDRVREEAGSYISQHPLWDGRRWSMQATEILENGLVQLRIVVTTADSDARWDLCCDLREHLIGFLQTVFPESLPRMRTELTENNEGSSYAAMWPTSAFRGTGRPSRTNGVSDSADGDGAVESGDGDSN